MTFYCSSYARQAERLVEALRKEEIQTQGQIGAWLDCCSHLPDPLRVWVFRTITPIIGTDGTAYLASLLPAPIAEVTA